MHERIRDHRFHRFSRGFTLPVLCALIMAAGLLSAGCLRQRSPELTRLTAKQRALNVASFDTVWTTIRDQHWDPTLGGADWDAARNQLRPQIARDATMLAARRTLSDLIGRLDTSHFAIIPTGKPTSASSADRYAGSDELLAKVAPAIRSAEQRYDRGDTGIVVRVLENQAVVVEVFPKSPAEVLGVRPGWIVQKIDGTRVEEILDRAERTYADAPLRELALARAIQSRLLGPTRGKVNLALLDGRDQPVELTIPFGVPRGRSTRYGLLPPVYVWSDARVLDDGAAYFRLSAFLDPPGVMPALEQHVLANLDAPGFILDLRGNQGGISAMARGIAGWFVRENGRYLGTVHMRDIELRFAIAPRPQTYNGPLAILVDGMSASTSEILAAGLRDMGRARVFGVSTAAAALPSLVRQLPNGDRFQHAVASYVSFGGETLEGEGIVPDELVAVTRPALLAGRDPVLEAAQAWIRVQRGAGRPADAPAVPVEAAPGEVTAVHAVLVVEQIEEPPGAPAS